MISTEVGRSSPSATVVRVPFPLTRITSEYGFKCSFNPTFTVATARTRGWTSTGYYGLDQGPVVLMLENDRSGLVWRLMRECPSIVNGLRRAGFTGGWLGAAS